MRTLIVLGTAGLFLATGAAESDAIPVLNKDAAPLRRGQRTVQRRRLAD